MGNRLLTILNDKRWEVFLFFWIVNVLLSSIYKYYYYSTGEHLQYTWIPDMLFLLLLIISLFYKRSFLAIVGIFFLLLSKGIGSNSIADFYPVEMDMYKDIVKSWMGYVYVFPLFLFLKKDPTESIINIPEKVKIFFLILVSFFVASVFLALVHKAYIFYTYTNPERFGISGFLFPSSYVSYFYILSIMVTYLLHKQLPSDKKYAIFIYILSAAAIFSGTKTTYLFLLVFYSIYILDNKYYQKKWFWVMISGLIITTTLLRQKIASIFSVLIELYQKEDFLTFAMSYRNVFAQDTWQFIQENWTWVNYLFGGLDNVNQLTEMAFIDLFLNFGIFGTCLFIYLYYKLILQSLRWTPILFVLAIGLLLLIAIGGNFFDRTYLAYWLVFLFLLQQKSKFISE